MEENEDSAAWNRWPAQHQSIERARNWLRGLPEDRQAGLARRQNFFCYVQWIAYQQWREIKSYAESRDIALMGDIPFGVSYHSADVFTRRDEFMLEWSAGAPPEPYFKDDAFMQKWGQNWGIPVYRWEKMRANNFEWWRERVRAVRSIFHLFRIDHVLGFYRIYAFPWRPRKNKQFLPLDWNQMLEQTGGRAPHFIPRDDRRRKLRGKQTRWRRISAHCFGRGRLHVCDRRRPWSGSRLHASRPALARHRRIQNPAMGGARWQITPGNEYERLSVATYTTHDHKPVRALWEEVFEHPTATSEQSRFDLAKIAVFAGFQPTIDQIHFEKDFYPAMMEALFKSKSWIAIVMITDLLARKYRFNVPGTKANLNWTRRMQRSIAQLSSSRKEQERMRLIQELLVKTGRV